MVPRLAPRRFASSRQIIPWLALVLTLLAAGTGPALAGPVQPTIFITDLTIAEGSNGPMIAQVTLALDNAPGGTVSVEYTTNDGTAMANDNDYNFAMGQVDFTGPFGSTINRTISVTVNGDTTPESDEFFFVDLFNPSAGVILGTSQSKVTLLDDDSFGAIELEISDAIATEGDEEIVFEVGLDVTALPVAGGNFFVQVDYDTVDGTASGGDDFLADSGTLVFTSPTDVKLVAVDLIDDQLAEPNETFEVRLSNPVGATFGRNRGTGVIRDDDTPPPTVSIADTSVVEGDDGSVDAALVLSLSRAPDTSSTVVWSTRDDSATAQDGDYRTTNGLVRFDVGETQQTITIPVFGDVDEEGDETFFVELSNAIGLRIGDGRATVTIEDDDGATPSTPRLSIGDAAVLEGDSGTVEVTFVVTLSAAADAAVRVDFETEDGTAAGSSDYAPTSGTLTFEPGETRREITVQVLGDVLEEDDETFFVRLAQPDGAEIDDGEGIGTIRNDDGGGGTGGEPPIAQLLGVTVDEGDEGLTGAVFELVLDRPADQAASVGYTTRDDTAQASDDDFVPATGRLELPAGATRASVRIDIVGDTRVEADESFLVELSEPQGLVLASPQARGTIRNDDSDDDGGGGGGGPGPGGGGGTVRLLVPAAALESGGDTVIVVERNGPASGAARAVVATRPGGSATAGSDHVPLRQAVTWGAGQTGAREVTLRLIDDNLREGDETILLTLAEVQGAAFGQPTSASLTVLDDDTPMHLEAVGEQSLEVRARSQVELAVRVVRDDGATVAGAPVEWRLDGNGARLLGPARVVSDDDGTASQRVALGPRPEQVQVTAALLGTDVELTFTLVALGRLVDDVAGSDEAELGIADVLDRSCVDAQGEFSQLCDFVFGLEDPTDRARVVRDLAPSRLVAQARSALRGPRVQIRNVNSRLTALRSGLTGTPLSQLSVALRGETIPFGPLLQNDSMRRAAVRSGLDELAFAHGPQSVIGGVSERGDGELNAVLERAVERARIGLRHDATAFAQANDSQGAQDSGSDTSADAIDIDDLDSPWGFFANGRISFGEAPQRGGDPGYDFGTEGLTAGIDYRVGAQGVVGAALGYVRSDIDFDDDGGTVDLDGWTLSLYGTLWRERWYVDVVAMYGVQDFESTRILELPAVFLGRQRFVARGGSDGDQIALHVASGVDWNRAAWTWGSYGRLSWVEATLDAYTETDAGPLTLRFDEQTSTSLLAEAGVEVSYAASVSWGVLQPLLRLAYLHEFEDGEQVLGAGFVQDPLRRTFTIRSEAPDRDYLNIAAALTATFPRGWSSYLQYDTDLARDDFDLHTVSGGFRLQF